MTTATIRMCFLAATARLGIKIVLLGGSIIIGGTALAHGGGLDGCGGHNNRKTGGYHVHNMARFCGCHPSDPRCGTTIAEQPKIPATARPTSQLDVPGSTAADTVYVTNTGKKYHRAGCSSLARSSIPIALNDATLRYGPCSLCSPPTAASGSPSAGATGSTVAPPAAGNPGQCAATTQKGTRCRRQAATGSSYCWQHGGR